MSYLSQMYGAKQSVTSNTYEKNPNRVVGGLKGHGADHYTMLGEDGAEQKIPSQKYVKALEEKIRMQDAKLLMHEKKLKSIANELHVISANQRLVTRENERKNFS